MKLLTKAILTILLLVLIAGCVEQTKADSGRFTKITSEYVDGHYIKVVHDNVNNVTLYVIFDNHAGHAISAIPDHMLKPPKGD